MIHISKTLMTLMTTSTLLAGCAGGDSTGNPLLSEWQTPYGVPPFEQIRLEHYRPAVETLIADGRQRIDELANNPDSATYDCGAGVCPTAAGACAERLL